MSRAERNVEIEQWRAELAGVRNALLVQYRGISVPQVTELRREVRKSGGRYAVVKNTLLSRAVEGAPLERLREKMVGPLALVYTNGDAAAVAKAIQGFAKTIPHIQVKAILLEGEALPGEQIEAVASMPGREELRAKLVMLLSSPMRRLVTAFSGPGRNFASVMKQRADKQQS